MGDTSDGLHKNDSEKIGFVIAALFYSAISREELHKWCFAAIVANDVDALPPYLFDLADFEGRLADIYKVVGFVPHWEHDDGDVAALFGIAVKRKREGSDDDWPVPPDVALQELAKRPAIEQRFRETFPFIEYL